MVLTEVQAQGLACPSQSDGAKEINCEGPLCMAWRWWDAKTRGIIVTLPDPPPGIDDDDVKLFEWIETQKPEGEGWVLSSEDWAWIRPSKKERRGYCGLAGKPDHD